MTLPGADPARPLVGATVVVTRAADAGDGLRAALLSLGARVVDCPVTRIVPRDPAPFDAALAAGPPDWLVLTSPRAVERAMARAQAIGVAPEALARCRVAVVGAATADAARAWGLGVTAMPARFDADALLATLAARDDVRGARVVFPVAAGAREVLADGLRALGADVTVTVLYASEPDPAPARALGSRLAAGELHAVTFAASSAVRAFVDAVGAEACARTALVSIGPVTSGALAALGLAPAAEASPSTLDGLAAAVVAALAPRAVALPGSPA